MFLKEREEEREEEEEEDISIYWRKFQEARRSWKLKEEILDRPAGRTALEVAVDLSKDRLHNYHVSDIITTGPYHEHVIH